MDVIRIGIRMARLADADGIASIYVDSWRETYAGILPEAGLLRMSKADHTIGWQRTIRSSNLRNPVLVAADDKGDIFGFVSAGPARDRSLSYEGEVYTLYIAPGRTGQGLGTALFSTIFRLFAKANCRGMVIWALADNPSRFFYEAMGGRLIAEREHALWGKSIREVGYGWRSLDIGRPAQRVRRNAEPKPPFG